MTTEEAKAYLSKREIPQLFESLMTGLMFYRPEDHIQYMQSCLQRVKEKGLDTVRWNIFIESRKKTPLPPINSNKTRTPSPAASEQSQTEKVTKQPEATSYDASAVTSDDKPAVKQPIVLVTGGPGCGKTTLSQMLCESNALQDWAHISNQDIQRRSILTSGTESHDYMPNAMKYGELVDPEHIDMELLKAAVRNHSSAQGFLLEGFPRNLNQLNEFAKSFQVDLALCLDADEAVCNSRLLARAQKQTRLEDNPTAVAYRIQWFKNNTLQMMKEIDDDKKLVLIDANLRPDEMYNSAMAALKFAKDNLGLDGDRLAEDDVYTGDVEVSEMHSSDTATVVGNFGFNGGKFDGPTIFLLGGPGSGRTTQSHEIRKLNPGFTRISFDDILRNKIVSEGLDEDKMKSMRTAMNSGQLEFVAEEVKQIISSLSNSNGIVFDGFPLSEKDLDVVSDLVGAPTMAVLLDLHHSELENRLSLRFEEQLRLEDGGEMVKRRLETFSSCVLPLAARLDKNGQLLTVNGNLTVKEISDEINKVVKTLSEAATVIKSKQPSSDKAEHITYY